MVGAVASRLALGDGVALTLYQGNFFLDQRAPFVREPVVLIPEIVQEREISREEEPFGYNRRGQMNRIGHKGVFVDTYL